MASVETPIGRLQWDGDLTETTEVTIIKPSQTGGENTHTAPLSRIIALTNGAVLPYLPDKGAPADTPAQ